MTQNSSYTNTPSDPGEATRLLFKNWREKFVMPLLIGTLVLGLFVFVPALSSAAESIFLKVIFITTYVLAGIVAVVKFPYDFRISVFLFGVYALGLGELLRYGILGDGAFFFLALIVFATMLLSPRAGVISIVMVVLTIAATAWLMLSETIIPIAPYTSGAVIQDWVSGSAMIIMIGAVIILGFQRLESAFRESQKQIDENVNAIKNERIDLERKVNERTRQLHKLNEIGRTITAILNPDELLTRAAQLIGDEFDCYHTAIYLTDVSGQWAELKVATGEAGKVLRESRHHVDINGKNTIGAVLRSKQINIASGQNTTINQLENPLFPYTRSQITAPLIIGERVIGALEMHSSKENAFSHQDADTYQNMANQVAIALENSRLFTEAQQSIREMSATQQQYLHGAWQSIIADKKFEYALGSSDLDGGQEIEVPLTLREQIIGQIKMSNTDEWTPEQKKLVESIAAQAALALENARLVENSESIALRERLANEVTSKIWASSSMDSILQTTVRELGRVLEASEVNIEISMGGEDE